MHRRITAISLFFTALFSVAGGATARSAAPPPNNVHIRWLTMSPTALGSPVPNNSVINVPGIGKVIVTYSIPSHWVHTRTKTPSWATGSVVNGQDLYDWSNWEHFATIFIPGDLGPEAATITYTFPRVLPAGSVFVGAVGLGATTSFGGGTSTTTVNQNGTFLGDYNVDSTFGASMFTGGAGTFTLQNSVTGAGGVNPHWNTKLGVVRIDDAVSSITVYQSQLRGDGIAVNIGFDIPRHRRFDHRQL